MVEWRGEQRRLSEEVCELRKSEVRKEHLSRSIEKHKEKLEEALVQASAPPPAEDLSLASLCDYAEDVISRNSDAQVQKEKLTAALARVRRELDQALASRKETADALARWAAEWEEAVSAIGLDASTAPSEARELLERLDALRETLTKQKDLSHRIASMERDAKDFGSRVEEMCRAAAPDLVGMVPWEAIETLHERCDRAYEASLKRKALDERRRECEERIDNAKRELDEARTRLQILVEEAGCETAGELADIESRAAAAGRLKSEISRTEAALSGYRGSATIEELEAEAEEVDPDALPAQISTVEDDIQRLNAKRDELLREEEGERKELERFGGEDGAARKEARLQELAATVEELAERYAVRTLAAEILSREIERYRDANQGPIVKAAGKLFSRLTSSRFDGLTTDYDADDNPTLTARRNSTRLHLDQLSDGTLDQLFLALRLAFVRRRAEGGEPLPLILDDVLVNFDDERAAAALRTFAEVSKDVQVIFFTHHAHLLDLAEKTVDSHTLFIQRLD
jgi:uncharacterized protein YhaN